MLVPVHLKTLQESGSPGLAEASRKGFLVFSPWTRLLLAQG